MRILLLSEHMNVGGTANEILLLCKQLKKQGYNFIIASNGGQMVRDLNNLGIHHHYIPCKFKDVTPINIIAFPLMLIRILLISKKKRIDLIHSYVFLFPLLLGWLTSKILRIPFIATTNDGILDHPFKLYILKTSSILKHATKITTISAEMKYLLSNRNNRNSLSNRIIVFPNMVDFNSLDADASYSKKSIGSSYSSKRIVWVSRLAPDKIGAIKNLINAAPLIIENYPDVQIIIVGQGSKYRQIYGLAEKMNRHLGAKVVIVAGYMENAISVMKSADIIIGMGKVVIEGMACRKPVIVVGHIIGPLGGNFGGILNRDNVFNLRNYNYSGRNSKIIATPKVIGNACKELLNNMDYRMDLGNFGRSMAENIHDSRKIAGQMMRLYQDVLLKGTNQSLTVEDSIIITDV